MAKKKEIDNGFEDKRKPDYQKYALALTLTIIIFVSGIFVGNWIADKKFLTIETMGQDIRTEIIALELQQSLIEKDICGTVGLKSLSDQLFKLGTRLDFMETRYGVNDPDVLALKQYYSLIEIRHWMFMRRMKDECGINNNLILYFYSNKGDCPRCEEQGFVLSYLHNKYEDTLVYSFDINLHNAAADTLKNNYGITAAPTVVVNDKIFKTYQDRDALESALIK